MDKREVIKKILVEISRILLGFTFVLSGFTKAVDPLGFAYKIQDYITSFGVDAFYPLALPISISLCVLEFSLGAFLLLGIYRKWSSRMVFLIMLFMTPFTLYIAIANPVEDCGCFGDAIIITNWQTFFKNIILIAAAFVLLKYHEMITNLCTGKFYWLVGLYVVFFGIGFSAYNSYIEPIFDFRPYKKGANLAQLMSVEEGKGDVYENIFVYEKNGEKKEFTEDNYPWQDSTWVFVDRINKLVKEGEKPLIHDFEINRLYFNPEKNDFEEEEKITNEIVMEDSSYIFLMISYSLTEMNESYLAHFEDVNNYAKEHSYKFYCLTSSSKDDILKWHERNPVNFNFCHTDERTLKTIIRSNPGLLLLKNGVIINKWPGMFVPDEGSLTTPLPEMNEFIHPTDIKADNKKNMTLILIIFLAPIFLFISLDLLIFRKKKPEEPAKKNKEETTF